MKRQKGECAEERTRHMLSAPFASNQLVPWIAHRQNISINVMLHIWSPTNPIRKHLFLTFPQSALWQRNVWAYARLSPCLCVSVSFPTNFKAETKSLIIHRLKFHFTVETMKGIPFANGSDWHPDRLKYYSPVGNPAEEQDAKAHIYLFIYFNVLRWRNT